MEELKEIQKDLNEILDFYRNELNQTIEVKTMFNSLDRVNHDLKELNKKLGS